MKVFKVSGKQILSGFGILLLLAFSAGCSESEKLSWDRLKDTHYRMITGKNTQEVKAASAKAGQATRKGQVAQNGQAAQKGQSAQKGQADKQQAAEGQQKVAVALYFADQNGDYLISEQREITMQQGLARATVQELIDGPRTKGLSRTIPDGTKLKDINIEEGLCTVDLSREFRDNHWGGSSGELLTVYSLVDTLTQFSTIERVEVLVEGQKIDTLAGHMDLSAPVYRNSEIIKSEK